MTTVMPDGYGPVTANKYEKTVSEYAYGYEPTLEIVCKEIGIVQWPLLKSKSHVRVLDLGAGTGRLSRYVAKMLELRNCEASFTLLDQSESMLSQAKEHWNHSFSLELVECSLEEIDPSALGTYDLVISSFALHHLTGEVKTDCFRKIFHLLEADGLFLIADRMVDESTASYSDHLKMVGNQAHPLFEQMLGRDLDFEELEAVSHDQFKKDGDTPEPVEAHLQKLKESGFKKIRNPYYNYGASVVVAHKG